MHRFLYVLLVALLTAPCWSAERSVGELLTIPLPEGVRARDKNPYSKAERHELYWKDEKSWVEGFIQMLPDKTDVSQIRSEAESYMAKDKGSNTGIGLPAGTYSPITVAPLERGPWKALWYTHEQRIQYKEKEFKGYVSVTWSMTLLLWDGKQMWLSRFQSSDRAPLSKWLRILESVQFNSKGTVPEKTPP